LGLCENLRVGAILQHSIGKSADDGDADSEDKREDRAELEEQSHSRILARGGRDV